MVGLSTAWFLQEAGVQVSDSRPSAWFETGRISTREPARIRVTEWLEPHFAEHPELVPQGYTLYILRALNPDGSPR